VSWRDETTGAFLAVAARDWEPSAHASLAILDGVVVAADASVYYRRDLIRALRASGAHLDTAASAARLVAEAYRTWGAAGLERLEGDFAAAIWDRSARSLVLARDFTGATPLFHADMRGGGVAASSSMDALLAIPEIDATLDRDVLAQSSSWIFVPRSRTVHRGIARLEPGAVVALDGATGRELSRREWEAPIFERAAGELRFDAAAEQLRTLLREAVRERLSPTAPSSVWMSGGYDSTAVFAAGRDAGAGGLVPVSVSYPPGDTGREDEAIELVASRFGATVHWLQSANVDLFARMEATATLADEPFVHLYAEFNAALARTSVAAGARVAMGGYGGDQLFWASNVYLADLLQQGRLRTLWSDARRLRLGAAGMMEWIVNPLLPSRARDALRRLAPRSERLLQPLERPVPRWITPAAARDAGLAGAFHRARPRRNGESRSAYDTYFSLTNPFYGRVLEAVSGIARENGVDYRSPLYDARLVAFAATRPRAERNASGEHKRLLRRAMKSLLPASILAPRPYKTGTARDLFAASAQRWLPPVLERVRRAPLLGDLGVLDVDAFRRACDDVTIRGDMLAAGALFPTLQTELWLRGADHRAARLAARAREPVGATSRATSAPPLELVR
jgi:asparagine synthase (glutamine-hydrolysing)